MLRRVLTFLLTLALLTGAASAAPLAAGDERGAWVVAPSTRAAAILFFLPPDSTDGLAYPVTSLPTLPIAVACAGDSAFLLFPRRASSTPGVDLYPARLITRQAGPPSRPEFTRPEILAPLPDGGEILRIALVVDTPLVLRRSVTSTGPILTLEALRANEWRSIALPDGADPTARSWLLAISGKPALAQQRDPHSIRLWTLPSFGSKQGPNEWTEQTIPSPAQIDSLIPFPTAPRALISAADSLQILALEDGRFTPTQTISIERSECAAVPWNAGLAVFWSAARADSGLDARLIASDGTVLFDGPLGIAGPVSRTELQLLVVLLTSVFLTAVIFMLRPESRAAAPLNFPPNASLATPSRRAIAFLIDLIPGLGAAYFGWFAGAHTLTAAATILAEHGAAPILTSAALTIALMTIGEATTGRTLGKALTRCRTISYTGQRPRWRQALARNAVKVLCPPIGLFILLAPASPHPGSFDTLVIVDRPPGRGPDDASPPPSPPHRPSDRS